MSGKVSHFEVPFDDGDRARAFYRAAFGWQVNEMPGMDYTLVATGPMSDTGMPTEPGFINGGMFARSGSPLTSPTFMIEVASIDESLARIHELGGTTVVGKERVGEMGFAAYFRDSEGNVLGLWEDAPPPTDA
jgi:predicted enzyme related to lactoylglutathione lyase